MSDAVWGFIGVIVGGVLSGGVTIYLGTRAATWGKRQETLSTMRWAAEQTDATPGLRSVAIAALEGLVGTDLLQPQDDQMVLGVYEAMLTLPLQAYRGDGSQGEAQVYVD